ncbi:hypothetical protein HDR66_01365 [bacterium]|nr:hypothetical protein [bacterium]
MQVSSSVTEKIKGLLNNYVSTTTFNNTKKELTEHIANNSERVSVLRSDLESTTKQTKAELAQKLLETDQTITSKLENYIPTTDRVTILNEAAIAVEKKLADEEFLTSAKLNTALTSGDLKTKLDNMYLTKNEKADILTAAGNTTEDILNNYVTVDVLNNQGFLKTADKVAILADVESATNNKLKEYVTTTDLNSRDFLTNSDLTATKLADRLGTTYVKTTDINGTIDNRIAAKNYLTDADLTATKLADRLGTTYVKTTDINGTIDNRIATKNLLTDADLTATKLADRLGTTYVKTTDIDGTIDNRIATKNFLTDADLNSKEFLTNRDKAAIIADALSATTKEIEDKGYLTDADLGKKNYLTTNDFTAERLKSALGDTYMTKDALNTDLSGRGFLTAESEAVKAISKNIDDLNNNVSTLHTNVGNLDTNLKTTVTSINGLSDRVSATENSLKKVDTTFTQRQISTTIDIERMPVVTRPSLTLP